MVEEVGKKWGSIGTGKYNQEKGGCVADISPYLSLREALLSVLMPWLPPSCMSFYSDPAVGFF